MHDRVFRYIFPSATEHDPSHLFYPREIFLLCELESKVWSMQYILRKCDVQHISEHAAMRSVGYIYILVVQHGARATLFLHCPPQVLLATVSCFAKSLVACPLKCRSPQFLVSQNP